MAVVVFAFMAFLYYRPVQAYLETRDELARRTAEVQDLRRQHRRLERRVASQATSETLVREARRLGFVKPGEQLFIVKGIPEWRRSQAPRARG